MPAALIRRQNKKAATIDTSKRDRRYFHLEDVLAFGGGAFLVLCAGVITGIVSPTLAGKIAAVSALAIGIALAFMRTAPFALTLLFAFAHGTGLGWIAKQVSKNDADAAQAIFATLAALAAYFVAFFFVHRTSSFLTRMFILVVAASMMHTILHNVFALSGTYYYVKAPASTLPFSVFSLVILLLLSFILTRDSFAIEEVKQAQRPREIAPMIAYSLMLAPVWILIDIIRAFIHMFNNSGDIPIP